MLSRMGVVDALTEWRARRWLAVLSTRLGTDGLTVAACVPGLAAAVGLPIDPAGSLIARCIGVWTALFGLVSFELFGHPHHGVARSARFDVTLKQVEIDAAGQWTRADWLALRLLAVCAMSRTCAPRPRPDRPRPGRSVRTR